MKLSTYIQTTSMTKPYKAQIILAMLAGHNTLRALESATGIPSKVLKAMPLKVMAGNGAISYDITTGAYSFMLEIDRAETTAAAAERLARFGALSFTIVQ